MMMQQRQQRQHLMHVQTVIHDIVTRMATSTRPLLGPHGQCRIITGGRAMGSGNSNSIIICRDSETLLNQWMTSASSSSSSSAIVQYPMVAALVIRMVRQVSAVSGDGCNSCVLLLSTLMDRCMTLMDQLSIHPNRIAAALDKAAKFCTEILTSRSEKFGISALVSSSSSPSSRASNTDAEGSSGDVDDVVLSLDDTVVLDRKILLSVAMTGASCRLEHAIAQDVALACVDAMTCVYGNGLTVRQLRDERVHTGKVLVQTCRHLHSKAEFVQGIVIDQAVREPHMPHNLQSCRILLITEPLELVKKSSYIKTHSEFHTAEERVKLVQGERQAVDNKVMKMIETGCNLVISCAGIDPIALSLFSQHGIAALRHVGNDLFDKLIGATKARVVHSIYSLWDKCDKESIQRDWLGKADKMETMISKHGDKRLTFITGTAEPRTSSVVLYGPTRHMIRSMHNACMNTLNILRNTFEDCLVAPGAGATEMALAHRVRQRAAKLDDLLDRKVFMSVSKALELSVPAALCANSGFVTQQCIDQWRRELSQEAPRTFVGIDIHSYPPAFIDPLHCGVLDSMRTKIQIVAKSMETLTVLLKIDAIIRAESLSKKTSQSQNSRQQQHQAHSVPVHTWSREEEEEGANDDDDDKEFRTDFQTSRDPDFHPIARPQAQQVSPHPTAWRYRRYQPGFDRKSAWSQEAKDRVRRKDEKFYSAQETQRRQFFEKNFALVDPRESEYRKYQQQAEHELHRRRREAGLGYNLDPFR